MKCSNCFGHLVLMVVGGWMCLVVRPADSDEPSSFHSPVRLMAGEEYIDTGEAWGHAGPTLADVDNDGLRDLVVGDFSGKFRLYRNQGTDAEPRFGRMEYLMAGEKEAQVHVY